MLAPCVNNSCNKHGISGIVFPPASCPRINERKMDSKTGSKLERKLI